MVGGRLDCSTRIYMFIPGAIAESGHNAHLCFLCMRGINNTEENGLLWSMCEYLCFAVLYVARGMQILSYLQYRLNLTII